MILPDPANPAVPDSQPSCDRPDDTPRLASPARSRSAPLPVPAPSGNPGRLDIFTVTEVEHALRTLGVVTRSQAANALDVVPIVLSARERAAVLRRLDEPEQHTPESGKILRPLGPGLSGPGGPAGDES